MTQIIALSVISVLMLPSPAAAEDPPSASSFSRVALRTIGYAPSRVLDFFDFVRVRGRVGPGTAISVRATESADLFAGTYFSAYAGLPGPRGRVLPNLPVGLELSSGVEVGSADAASGAGFGPRYGATEFGVGIHFLVAGIDVGLDPIELVDWAVGFLGVDLRQDDI
jgi:hypothetical protein